MQVLQLVSIWQQWSVFPELGGVGLKRRGEGEARGGFLEVVAQKGLFYSFFFF